ncbi:hypothetical protein SLEP1_g39922 [Rubroshorea leprosula]|uniref:Uncharacterized protein n=1 Tax=Rubroshorea leprosula TaxID=152421 RepID=A0AAV5L2L2_9ROSI|nr:hypothetical protein SLEP1_g39922 [Rubroshorea leprosula]
MDCSVRNWCFWSLGGEDKDWEPGECCVGEHIVEPSG